MALLTSRGRHGVCLRSSLLCSCLFTSLRKLAGVGKGFTAKSDHCSPRSGFLPTCVSRASSTCRALGTTRSASPLGRQTRTAGITRLPFHAPCSDNKLLSGSYTGQLHGFNRRVLREPVWLEAGSKGTGQNSFFLDCTLHINTYGKPHIYGSFPNMLSLTY